MEHKASGWAIAGDARRLAEENSEQNALVIRLAGSDPNRITTQLLGEAAQQGDPFAIRVVKRACDYLSEAIVQVITLLCPRRIIIGGGVSLLGEEVLFKPLRELVAERVFRPFADCYDIVPAALGEEVVLHGALALARRRLEK